MYLCRFSRKKYLLLILVAAQVVLILYFFLYRTEAKEGLHKISFLTGGYISKNKRASKIQLDNYINLERASSRGYFLDFNSSMCFTEGTDIKTMIVAKGINWKCNCLPGDFILNIRAIITTIAVYINFRMAWPRLWSTRGFI